MYLGTRKDSGLRELSSINLGNYLEASQSAYSFVDNLVLKSVSHSYFIIKKSKVPKPILIIASLAYFI